MAYSNKFIEIHIGNVDASLVGPVPRERLEREVNPHPRPFSFENTGPTNRPTLVFDGSSNRFLAGALPQVKRVLRDAGAAFRVRDLRTDHRERHTWALSPSIELRPYQSTVVDEAIRVGKGLIDIGTGGGKTVLAAAIVARIGLPTLYLVTTRTLLHQSVRALSDALGEEPGVIGEGVRDPKLLTVALVQALDTGSVDLTPWLGGTLVFDEGHHAAASSYLELIRRLQPRYHYYLSAVPFRSGEDQAVLYALAGPPLTKGRYSARFLIESGYACPVDVRLERIRLTGDMRERPFADLYREFIVENSSRNSRIAALAREAIERGDPVLILVDHVRHGELVHRLLRDAAHFLHGSTPRGRARTVASSFARGELPCLIATAGLFAEGVSIDGIQVLIHAGGLKSRTKVLQAVGRGMRKARGKRACTYVDFWDDDTAGVFRAHSLARMQVLKREGFSIPPLPESPTPVAVPIPPRWHHVSGTDRFLMVDGEGRVHARARCLQATNVPAKYCRKCSSTVCENGGEVTWHVVRD